MSSDLIDLIVAASNGTTICEDCGRPAKGNGRGEGAIFALGEPLAWCWNAPSIKNWRKGTCLTRYGGEA